MGIIVIGGCIAGAAIIFMIHLLAIIDKAAKKTDKIFDLMEIFADRILRLETKPSFIPKKSTYKKIQESFHETTTPLTIKEIYAKEKAIKSLEGFRLNVVLNLDVDYDVYKIDDIEKAMGIVTTEKDNKIKELEKGWKLTMKEVVDLVARHESILQKLKYKSK